MNGTTVTSGTVVANIWTGWAITGTGDFDGDGRTDILWRENSGGVAMWLMDGPTVKSGSTVANLWIGWTVGEREITTAMANPTFCGAIQRETSPFGR